MAVKTKAQFVEDLKRVTPRVYIGGERVDSLWNDPRFQSTINLLGATYDFSFDEDFKHLSVVTSPLVNEPVRRLNMHIQTTAEDAVHKVRLTREVTQRRICTWCQSNMLCILWASTYETDRKHGTPYHERCREFVKHLMRNDYNIGWAMMDPKGDRSLPPSKQRTVTDLRITKRGPKGITVRGCKVHTSYAPCATELVVVSCRALGEADADFAVSFAVPVDTKGITYIVRPAPNRPGSSLTMECPIGTAIGAVEAMTVFDDVFVPWDRVFQCGEWDMAGRVPYYFGNIQRQSKCACLAGHTDLICGIAALVADVNGLGMKTTHIRDKITRLMLEAETAYGCAVGAGADGRLHPSGVWVPNELIANAGLNYIKNLSGGHITLIHDIAGGIIVTMPTEQDYRTPILREWMDAYLAGSSRYTAEERMRALYLAREVAASRWTGYFFGWAINASGSPMTNEVVVRAGYDLEKRIAIAKHWAGITKA